ncbi:MAG TPA: tetratricopeptide repeat protein [Pyrinomonadaceae bacterium]|nr:tetratricopeptide repeat protein [Pyrinomonadaceae bacterium]
MMRKVSSAAGLVAVVAAVGVAAGCGQIGMLKGKMAFKDANALYGAQNYSAASKKYEEAIAQGCSGDSCRPPEITYAYFFLASSYDNMFKPAKKDDPKQQELLKKAVANYQKAAEISPNPEYKKRALQYLVAIHGPDKLNDPGSAEPIVQRLIQMDPNDITNYLQMAKLYEDAGEFDKAEAQFLKARDVKPNDADVYAQLAGYYERRGNFDKQMEALVTRAEKSPDNPEAQYIIANTYWNKACLPSRPQCVQTAPASEAVKAKYVQSGLEAADKAIGLRKDYVEALVFKNLLLRSEAYLEKKDAARQKQLINEADQLLNQVQEIRKRQAAQPATKPGAKKSE